MWQAQQAQLGLEQAARQDCADRQGLRVLLGCKVLRGLLDATARLVQRALVLLVNKGQSAQMELLEWLALAELLDSLVELVHLALELQGVRV
jgi:hypothetical protein